MSKRAIQTILTFSFLFCVFTVAFAQPELDISFNGTGWVTTDLTPNKDIAYGAAAQPDHKIIVVGANNDADVSPKNFVVIRYNADGSRDQGFGIDGIVISDLDPSLPYETAKAAAIQPDGKIIVVGYAALGVQMEGYMAVARYNPNGSLDTSFGTGGRVLTSYMAQRWHQASAVTIAPDGKIVVAGHFYDIGSYQALLARYNTDGTLDTNFGIAGLTTDVPITQAGITNVPNAVGIQSDGKIVTAGISWANFAGPPRGTVVRYNADGSHDGTFGVNGRVVPSSVTSEYFTGVGFLPDGRIVVGGQSGPNFLAMRFNANGPQDTTFDGDGRASVPMNSGMNATGFSLRPSGKMLITGMHQNTGAMAIVCLNADGSRNLAFSGDGILFFGADQPWALTSDSLGRLIVAGTAKNMFAVARLYTVDPVPVTVGGRAATPAGAPIRGIRVGLTDQAGQTRWAITSNFGYYQFEGVPTGQTYTLFVRGAKRHTFEARVFGLNEAIEDLDLIGVPRDTAAREK